MSKTKVAVILSAMILLLYACTKEADIRFSNPPTNANPDTVNLSYDLVETFEHGSKTGYNSTNDTVTLSSGIWAMKDALIGNMASDGKIDSWSVRIQNTGTVTTTFKVNGLMKVLVSASTYGKDAASSYQLQTSTDSTTFTQAGNTINLTSNVMQTDSFTITSGSPVFVRITKSSTGKRINIDNVEFRGIGNPGFKIDTSGGTSTPPNYDGDTTPRYVVVTQNDIVPPTTGDNSNMLLGNPSDADSTASDADNYLFNQHYYIESYSKSQGKPNWTAWHLGNEDIGSSGRSDDFAAWAGLPADWYRVGASDYASSGFERGHNCPSADRTSTVNANDATFLMTNMMPQAPDNNEKTWANLENDTRDLVKNGNEAYIYCGSYGQGGSVDSKGTIINTIDDGHITVPAYTWKIVVIVPKGDKDISRITADTRVIAVNMPNKNGIDSDWKKYIVTVKDIESATGYSFFSSITDATIKSALKSKKDSGN